MKRIENKQNVYLLRELAKVVAGSLRKGEKGKYKSWREVNKTTIRMLHGIRKVTWNHIINYLQKMTFNKIDVYSFKNIYRLG